MTRWCTGTKWDIRFQPILHSFVAAAHRSPGSQWYDSSRSGLTTVRTRSGFSYNCQDLHHENSSCLALVLLTSKSR